MFYHIYDKFGSHYITDTKERIASFFLNKSKMVNNLQDRLAFIASRGFVDHIISPATLANDFEEDVDHIYKDPDGLDDFCDKYGFIAEPAPLTLILVDNYIKQYPKIDSGAIDPLLGSTCHYMSRLSESNDYDLFTQEELKMILSKDKYKKNIEPHPPDTIFINDLTTQSLEPIEPPNRKERQRYLKDHSLGQMPTNLLKQVIQSKHQTPTAYPLFALEIHYQTKTKVETIFPPDASGLFKKEAYDFQPDAMWHNLAYKKAIEKFYDWYRYEKTQGGVTNHV